MNILPWAQSGLRVSHSSTHLQKDPVEEPTHAMQHLPNPWAPLLRVAPFLYLVLVWTLQEAGQPGCGASPPLETLARLTRRELPHRAVCQLGFAPTPVRAGLGGLFPPFQHRLGTCSSLPHQSLPKPPHRATTGPRWGFQPPHRSSAPPHPALQTPCVPAQPGHGAASLAKPHPRAHAGAGRVNIFPVTSHWPLVLWKKPKHLVIIFL